MSQNKTTVEIFTLDADTDLHAQYRGQSDPQPAYVQLDCTTGNLTCAYNAVIGNAVPADVYHGHTIRWTIPNTLSADQVNRLLADIQPLAQRVVDGCESVWNGHNHIARFDDDATDAKDQIERLCRDMDGEGEMSYWDASDYLYEVRNEIKDQLRSGSTVDELVTKYEGEVEPLTVVDGVEEYIQKLADELAEEIADEDDNSQLTTNN